MARRPSSSGGDFQVSSSFAGVDTLVEQFKLAPKAVVHYLRLEMARYAMRAKAAAASNIQSKSGRLAANLYTRVSADDDQVTVELGVRGVPYARIQEEGGRIRAHRIFPRDRKALAFLWMRRSGTGIRFAIARQVLPSVNHPGATIRAKNYISRAIEQTRAEFMESVEKAVQSGMNEASRLTGRSSS